MITVLIRAREMLRTQVPTIVAVGMTAVSCWAAGAGFEATHARCGHAHHYSSAFMAQAEQELKFLPERSALRQELKDYDDELFDSWICQ